jgi:molecular chaperone IbpA
MLALTLKREIPEAMKPRRIEIGGAGGGPQHDRIEAQAEDRQSVAA